MRLSTERVDSAVILHLDGRLTIEVGDSWLETSVEAGSRAGVRHVLLQMDRVRQLDCAGIGQLVQLRAQLHQARRTCALVAVDPRQRHLLELAGLHRVFRMFDDCDDAKVMLGVGEPGFALPTFLAAAPTGLGASSGASIWCSWAGWAESGCVT
jgi:anti-anti-sigma factor